MKRDRELDEELRAHFRMAIEERIRNGEDPVEAERNARKEFGNELQVREVTREVWGWDAWERFGLDLKFALRQMRRNAGFTVVALITLALGLGATTAIFSIVNDVLLQPLKFRDPGRLYMAENVPPPEAGLDRKMPVNARHFYEWRQHCTLCEDVALFQGSDMTLMNVGEPVRLPGLDISDNFFRTLGVRPAIGRDFLEVARPSIGGNVILTDSLWRSRFNADPSIVGHSFRFNGELWTVIGILPANFRLPRGQEWGAFAGPPVQPLIFRPLLADPSQGPARGNLNWSSVVRLRPGVTREQAEAQLNALIADFVRQYRILTKVGLTPLNENVIRTDRAPLLLLLGAVGAVLLIVCVNIGNLMLVRTASRHREAGVRLALGASRFRIFRLVLIEALLLVFAGGAAGFLLAQIGLKQFIAWAPVSIPRLDEVHLDGGAIAFALILVALSTVVCGVAPAWQLARVDPQESLRAGAGNATEGGRKLRFREWMVGFEVALSTVLLVTGGLLIVSFFRLAHVDTGFETAHVVTEDISFLNPKYKGGVRRGFVEDMVEQLAALPGVGAAGATSQLPLLGAMFLSTLEDADGPHQTERLDAMANFRFTTPGYLRAMGVPLRRGRLLEEADRNTAHIVISEQAARYLWGNQNPIGKHIIGPTNLTPVLEVVGVVGEVRSRLEEAPPMMVYEHFWRMQPVVMSFVVRTRENPASVAAGIRAVFSKADPEMAVSQPRTMEQIMEESMAARRFRTELIAVFAVSALVLAALGIYGIISFAVVRRTPEIGIRMALGANSSELVRMVMLGGAIPVIGGLLAGVGGSLLIGRTIASQLFGVAANDPVSIGCVAVGLLFVAMCASWIPARRAARIDPLAALRFE